MLVTHKGVESLLKSNFTFSLPSKKLLATTLKALADTEGRVWDSENQKRYRAKSLDPRLILYHADRIDEDKEAVEACISASLPKGITWAEGK